MFKYGLPLIAALALTFAIVKIVQSQPVHETLMPPASPPAAAYPDQVGAVGLVEAASENIAISPPIAGLVTRVDVRAGDRVKKGARLFSLDSRDLEAELALRKSALALAAARLEQLALSPRPEDLPPAEAKLREAEQVFRESVMQLSAMEGVADKRAIRGEDLEHRRFAVTVAEARLDEVKAELVRLKAGASNPELAVARAEVDQERRRVERVEADMSRLIVTAPIDGEILQCKVHPGEYAPAGQLPQPLILMGNTARLAVRAEIDEEDAWRLKSGAAARATVRGNSAQHLPLRLVRVEPYVIPKRNLSGDGGDRVDTRVLQVVFELGPGAQVYAGQQVDVFIDAGEHR